MTYHCLSCGERFDRPVLIPYRSNLDGENGWYTENIPYCPECGANLSDDGYEEIFEEDDMEDEA